MTRGQRVRIWIAIIGLFAALPAILGSPSPRSASAAPAASTLSVAVNPLTSGTGPFDDPATCSAIMQVGSNDVIPANLTSTGQSHCPGMDFSGDPSVDRVVRTYDTIDVQIGWSITDVPSTTGYSVGGIPGDTNLVVASTLPIGPLGNPLATWAALPAGCYTVTQGTPAITPLSSLSNGNRTLTCNLGHRVQGSTGTMTASMQLTQYATDGTPLDIVGSIRSDSTRAAGVADPTSSNQRFWFSATPQWNLRAGVSAMSASGIIPGPANEIGKLVYSYVGIGWSRGSEALPVSSWAGGNSVPVGVPISFDVDLSELGTVAAADGAPGNLASRAKFYTWGITAGCMNSIGSATLRCTLTNNGATLHVEAFGINQTQAPGVLGTGERIQWSVRIAMWFPNNAIPVTSTPLKIRADHFDPVSQPGPNFGAGRSNYGGSGEACAMVAAGVANPANCEPGLAASTASNAVTSANDNDAWGSVSQSGANSQQQAYDLMDKDIRGGSNAGVLVSETNAATSPLSYGFGYSDGNLQVIPNSTYLASTSIGNPGGFVNTTPIACDKWDNHTQQLFSFGDATRPVAALQGNAPFPTTQWSEVNTNTNSSTAWHPGPKWNHNAPFTTATPHNLEADPAFYVVEFGVGEYTPYTPPPTSPALVAMRNTTCRDQDSAAGWFTDPTATGIQTWIDTTYGLGSGIAPLDVVNKVRIRLLDGLQPDQYVDLAVRLLVRSTWGPTSPVGTAGNAVPFGTRIAHHGAFTDSYLAPRSGTGYANGWYYGTYDAAVDNGALGDRLTLGGADLKTTTYSMFSSPTGLNGTTTLIAGQDVWWRVDTSVYSLVPGLQTAPIPAVPVRVISLIPAALTYVPGSGCAVASSYAPTSCAARVDPASVVANSDGTTTLVWDLGMMSPTVAGVVKTVEFRTTTDVLTVSNTLAATQSYVESVNSDGSANNSTPLCSYVAAPRTNRSIPASTNGPAEVLALPTVVCDPSSLNYRLSYRSITINNAASMAVSGRVAVQQIETREKDDGTGTKVAYGVTTKNFDSVAISSTDTISVLPWVGDGRTPASSFSGSFSLQGVSTTEALSTTPNALAGPGAATPPRSGTTFYFSSLSPQLVIEDPNDASNSANSTTPWCLQSDFGAVKNCPKSMSDVTAVRVIGGSIAANGASRAFTLRFDTSGDHAGDLFTLRAVSRSPNYLLAAPTVDASIVAVESSIGDTLWEDKNGNGVIDTNEPGRFSGVRVQLLDANGKAITSTVTDAFGVYSFAGLHAGTFTVRVVDSNGADGMLDRYPTYSSSYDADNFTIGGVDGDPDGSVKLALGRGQNRADIDFGYFNATISGRAFLDANRNGIKDLNENVFAGANVSLVGVSDTGIAVVRSATTAADGTYSIPGLRPGVYSVAATSGSSFVTAIVGSSGGKASGAAASGVALSAGANATGYDFGVQGAALSGRVFTDTNGNGTLDAGEQGILKLTVTFTTPTAGGAGKPTVFSSLTDGSGMFRF